MRGFVLLVVVAGWSLNGCSEGSSPGVGTCKAVDDCLRGEACIAGRCVGPDNGLIPVGDVFVDAAPGDGAADAGADGAVDVAVDGAGDGPAVLDPDAAADAAADVAPPDMAPDAALPDMALDMALPDMAVADPDLAVPDPDMAVVDLDMAVPDPDMAVPDPDMAVPDPDMAPPDPDMAPPDPDMAPPDPDMAPPDPDMAPPEPDMAPPPLGAYGAPCMAAAECASGICVNDPEAVGGICTVGCDDADGCPGGDVCLPAENGAGVCFRPETGDPCNDGRGCLSGICATPPDPVPWITVQSVCADRCSANRHCPLGFNCGVVESNDGPVRACISAVRQINTCNNGRRIDCIGTCVVPQGRDPQDINLCLDINNNVGPGYCSCTCRTSADCPAGYGCQLAPELSGDLGRPGICLAMAGYRCPFEARNPNVLQCPSLSCLGEDDLDASYCTVLCRNDLDCPTDYTCEDVGGAMACVVAP